MTVIEKRLKSFDPAELRVVLQEYKTYPPSVVISGMRVSQWLSLIRAEVKRRRSKKN